MGILSKILDFALGIDKFNSNEPKDYPTGFPSISRVFLEDKTTDESIRNNKKAEEVKE
jgi:hypothetical protein